MQETEASDYNTQEQSWDDYYHQYMRQAQDEGEYDNQEFCDIHFLGSTLPYFQCKTGNGEVLKFLIDTGSNKNDIQPSLAKNPVLNDSIFYFNSVGGKTKISHNIFLNLFVVNEKLKFFVLPFLKSFHGILCNDSLN